MAFVGMARIRRWLFWLLLAGGLPAALVYCIPSLEAQLYDLRLGLEVQGFEKTAYVSSDAAPHTSIVLLGKYEYSALRESLRKQVPKNWSDRETSLVVGRLLYARAGGILLSLPQSEQQQSDELRAASANPRCVVTDCARQEDHSGRMAPNGAILDQDGNYRECYLALGSPPVPGAALLLYARFLGVPAGEIAFDRDAIRIGASSIPAIRDERGWRIRVRLLPLPRQSVDGMVRSLGNDSTQSVGSMMIPAPAQSLLDPSLPLFSFAAGRFFFYGDFDYVSSGLRPTCFGTYRDFQFQALVLDTLIRGWHLWEPSRGVALLLAFGWSAFCVRLLSRTGRVLDTIVRAGVLGLACVGANLCLFEAGFLLPLAFPLASLLLVTAWGLVSQWDRSLLLVERFGGRAAAAAIAAGRLHRTEVEVEEREATILFTNLPDHLKYLEQVEAPEMFDRRRAYSDLVTRVVGALGGLVHDYQADYLMLGFGTEIGKPDPHHATRALQAGLALVKAMAQLGTGWTELHDPKKMEISVGLCTGPVALGFVGSKKYKRAPAAIGDTTNVAARLLVAARKMGRLVLMADRTRELLEGDWALLPLPPVELKGKSKPVGVFTLESLG
jgi:class 3 adenylate cyclase